MAFSPKRTSPADLARLVESQAGPHMPTTTPNPAVVGYLASPATKQEGTVQINFRGSKGLAKLISELAEQEGSTRKLIARLLKDAGHVVPEVDLSPPVNRRRFD